MFRVGCGDTDTIRNLAKWKTREISVQNQPEGWLSYLVLTPPNEHSGVLVVSHLRTKKVSGHKDSGGMPLELET